MSKQYQDAQGVLLDQDGDQLQELGLCETHGKALYDGLVRAGLGGWIASDQADIERKARLICAGHDTQDSFDPMISASTQVLALALRLGVVAPGRGGCVLCALHPADGPASDPQLWIARAVSAEIEHVRLLGLQEVRA